MFKGGYFGGGHFRGGYFGIDIEEMIIEEIIPTVYNYYFRKGKSKVFDNNGYYKYNNSIKTKYFPL